MDLFYRARKVYNDLEDDISKEIFITRIKVATSGDHSFVTNIPTKYRNLSSDIEMFKEKLVNNTQKMVIFGAGANGQNLVSGFRWIKFVGFIDNYRKDKVDKKTGLDIYSLDEFESKKGLDDYSFVISVSSRRVADLMYNQLIEKGVRKDLIIKSVSDWRNNSSQYFDFFVPGEDETFVDCGCFDGGSAFRFAGWCGAKGYKKIISFEPDSNSYLKCKDILSVLGKCEVYPYGLSDKNEKVYFISNGNEDARIISEDQINDENADCIQTIETVVLDEFLKNEKVTFIKMDIEGAEYDALVGASNIIREQKPKLAISVYHNWEHIINIPELLKKLNPDYKFYIRQYSLLSNETILYAE
ncbi:MAG: FkbM family methyltransferase [Lachnospiraceae bacterium]|nr:FkbM family methyltransferase [Lachnospiraceae bacterium]